MAFWVWFTATQRVKAFFLDFAFLKNKKNSSSSLRVITRPPIHYCSSTLQPSSCRRTLSLQSPPITSFFSLCFFLLHLAYSDPIGWWGWVCHSYKAISCQRKKNKNLSTMTTKTIELQIIVINFFKLNPSPSFKLFLYKFTLILFFSSIGTINY